MSDSFSAFFGHQYSPLALRHTAIVSSQGMPVSACQVLWNHSRSAISRSFKVIFLDFLQLGQRFGVMRALVNQMCPHRHDHIVSNHFTADFFGFGFFGIHPPSRWSGRRVDRGSNGLPFARLTALLLKVADSSQTSGDDGSWHVFSFTAPAITCEFQRASDFAATIQVRKPHRTNRISGSPL